MENSVYLIIGILPLFYSLIYSFRDKRDYRHQWLTIRILQILMHNSRVVRKVLYWLLLCLYYQVYIILCSYNISLTYNTTNQRLSFIQHFIQRFNTCLFTADHFILFVHSSRMFCCIVYFAYSCRRLLSATAGRRPPACCLPACCHWEHRSVPFIL